MSKGSTYFPSFDFMQRDYKDIYVKRLNILQWIREDSTGSRLQYLRSYYKNNISEFISIFVDTFDPRNVDLGIPANVPFVLFKKQEEAIDFFNQCRENKTHGLVEKSRECGISWIAIAYAVAVALFEDGVDILFGSKKADSVHKIGDINSLLEKAIFILENLPKEFTGGFDRYKHTKSFLVNVPHTNSSIKGDSGDNIGRGGRYTFIILDEAAFIERSESVDAAVSQSSRVVISVSTPNGMDNSFARKRFKEGSNYISFSWKDDPRKDHDWYLHQLDILDPVTIAQEIDISYTASKEGIIIPYDWISKAIDFHTKVPYHLLGGVKQASLDCADMGKDKNALTLRKGIVLHYCEEWRGTDTNDIFGTVEKAIGICNINNITQLVYDSDGLGAAIRGDSRRVNQNIEEWNKVSAIEYRGSNAVPSGSLIPGKSNQDVFANFKAYAYWNLRVRFQNTKRYLDGDTTIKVEDCISIDSSIKDLTGIMSELATPVYSYNSSGKILVDKTPNGSASPNKADSIVMNFVSSRQVLSYQPVDPNKLRKKYR